MRPSSKSRRFFLASAQKFTNPVCRVVSSAEISIIFCPSDCSLPKSVMFNLLNNVRESLCLVFVIVLQPAVVI